MKMHLLRRALCLLLVLSMLMPLAVSADNDPIYTYPSISIETKEGVTTNEMAYVDQFFNGAGGLNAKGRALEKWLDIGIREAGADRTNSGYLMLEQELEHQTSFKNVLSDAYIKTAREGLETIGSIGANIPISLIQEDAFRDRFPNSGKKAYVYYNYLYQIIIEYVSSMQAELEEVDNSFETIFDAVGEVTELVPDAADALDNARLAFIHYKHSDAIAIVPDRYNQRIEYKKLVDIDATDPNKILYGFQIDGQVKYMNVMEAIGPVTDGCGVVFDTTDLRTDISATKATLQTDIEKAGKIKGKRTVRPEDLSVEHLTGCIDGLGEAAKNDPKLSKRVKDAFSKAQKKAEQWMKIPEMEELQYKVKTFGNILTAAGVGLDVYGYFKDMKQITAQKIAYFNVIEDISREHLAMLEEWYDVLKETDLPDDAQKAMGDALSAVFVDIFAVHNGMLEKLAKEDAYSLTKGTLADSLIGIVEAVCSIKGMAGVIQAAVDAKAGLSTKLSAVSIGSLLLNMGTQRFIDFGDSSSAIYYLKWSLFRLLTDPGGLLDQYAENRSHRIACEIIAAINSMKSAKLIGENLIEEYYLYDFYKSQNIDWDSTSHAIIWNEMMRWDGKTQLNISASMVPIVAVYEEHATRVTDASGASGSWTGDRLDAYYYYDVSTEILGYYLNRGYDQASYSGRKLTSFPMRFTGLPNKAPSYDSKVNYIDTSISGDWLAGKEVTGTNRSQMYKNDRLELYSNNGMEMIVSNDKYYQALDLQRKINTLFYKYRNVEVMPDNEKDDALQTVCRIEWTILTRKWIESVEMYDESVDYSQYAFRCGSVR